MARHSCDGEHTARPACNKLAEESRDAPCSCASDPTSDPALRPGELSKADVLGVEAEEDFSDEEEEEETQGSPQTAQHSSAVSSSTGKGSKAPGKGPQELTGSHAAAAAAKAASLKLQALLADTSDMDAAPAAAVGGGAARSAKSMRSRRWVGSLTSCAAPFYGLAGVSAMLVAHTGWFLTSSGLSQSSVGDSVTDLGLAWHV